MSEIPDTYHPRRVVLLYVELLTTRIIFKSSEDLGLLLVSQADRLKHIYAKEKGVEAQFGPEGSTTLAKLVDDFDLVGMSLISISIRRDVSGASKDLLSLRFAPDRQPKCVGRHKRHLKALFEEKVFSVTGKTISLTQKESLIYILNLQETGTSATSEMRYNNQDGLELRPL